MQEITLDATKGNIARVTSFVEEALEQLDCSMKTRIQVVVAIDELFANIATYAYGDEAGTATVRLDIDEASRTISLCFIDEGIPFNPLEVPAPDITLPLDERPIGGLGIFMVRKSMDAMEYRHEDGKNILTVRKGY